MGAGGSRIGEKLKLNVNGSHKSASLVSLRTNFGHQINAHFEVYWTGHFACKTCSEWQHRVICVIIFLLHNNRKTFFVPFRSLIYKSLGLWALIMARNSSAFRTWACLPSTRLSWFNSQREWTSLRRLVYTANSALLFFRWFDGTWALSICCLLGNCLIHPRLSITMFVCVSCVTYSNKAIEVCKK